MEAMVCHVLWAIDRKVTLISESCSISLKCKYQTCHYV